MRKSIATVCLSGGLAEKLDAIAAAGFDGVEIFENDLLTSPLSPEQVKARLEDLGLGLDLFQPFRDFEAVSADRLAMNLRRARRKFELMQRLGATQVLVCSNVAGMPLDDDALAAEQLSALADLAAEFGVRVAYEALAWGRHVDDYRHAWRIVEMADNPSLGTCLDSFHILSRGSDPGAIDQIPGEKIFFLQLADAPVMSLDVLQWSRHFRCFPGQGDLDVADLTARVLGTGYDGPLSLEVFNDVFRQSPTQRTAVDAFRSLVALEEATAKHLPGGPLDLEPPTAASEPTGFAFTEVSVDRPDELDGLLMGLGFRTTGRHRTKPVSLWECGEARILVNADHRFPQTGLAAIGLECTDPDSSVRRAQDLKAPVLPRGKALDEAVLNSISAPDGTELFFCRTGRRDRDSWTADFEPPSETSGSEESTVGRAELRIDHVALTQPWQFFDEATLFYRSVLGLQPRDSLEVADPYGLVRSRAVSSTDGRVRLALNVQPAAFEQLVAAPLQHVALATDDIVETARRLRASGVPLLSVSPNYYDDLEARFDLAPGRVALFRELGLLYDRADAAEFLQLYTGMYGRVFFEVVQRIGGYDGYGAANAPYRLAAQHLDLIH